MSKKIILSALLLLSLLATAGSALAQDEIVCAAIVPQSAVLSSDGTIGLSLSSGPVFGPDGTELSYFSQFTPVAMGDSCFGAFAYSMIANSCLNFLNGVEDPIVVGSPKAIAGESCSAQDAEIQKLTKENRRLKNKLKRITR